MWRWDQGRLLYFQFDVLRLIANVLNRFDNVDVSKCESLFRETLENVTQMPFAPASYTVKRNYSRVFQCSFLATFDGNVLITTDICKELAKAEGKFSSADDYLFDYIRKFRFPFPAFDNYDTTEQRVYPFCAILKLLLARQVVGIEAKISLDDVFCYIIGNNCTGFEDIEFYKKLLPVPHIFTDTHRRQLREMLLFVSQLSILKVYEGYLYLEILSQNTIDELLEKYLVPDYRTPNNNRLLEFIEMTSYNRQIIIPALEVLNSEQVDVEFIEGKKRRVEHFRVERSNLLKKYYKLAHPESICQACNLNLSQKYPWADYMLDLHHLLPLASALAISSKGTSLEDIVGVCPSCHRAIHAYYRQWLNANNQTDFLSKAEAKAIFEQATRAIVL